MNTSHTSQTSQKSQVIKQKKPYMWALIFLILVAVVTWAAWFYNHSLETQLADIQTQISETDAKIDTMNANSNLLQVSALYKKNEAILSRLERRSKIVSYISHLSDISVNYGVALSGFEYRNDTVTSTLLSTSKNENALAYQNVVRFLSGYNADEKRLFDLGYISNISWHDSMKFELNFTTK